MLLLHSGLPIWTANKDTIAACSAPPGAASFTWGTAGWSFECPDIFIANAYPAVGFHLDFVRSPSPGATARPDRLRACLERRATDQRASLLADLSGAALNVTWCDLRLLSARPWRQSAAQSAKTER